MQERLTETFESAYEAKRTSVGPELMAHLERTVLLSVMDAKWKDHLYMMDALREGIGLRAYGQRDPIVEYQREAYAMLQDMIASIKEESLTMLLRVQPVAEARPTSVFANTPVQEVHPEISETERFAAPISAEPLSGGPPGLFAPPMPQDAGEAPRPARPQTVHAGPKVGRNEPCPCGSGLKYKKCHGK